MGFFGDIIIYIVVINCFIGFIFVIVVIDWVIEYFNEIIYVKVVF